MAEADRREMRAARPDPDRDPEWWTLTSAMAGEVAQQLDRPIPPTGFRGWPAVPQDSSAVGLFAGAWALLASLPKLRELHAQRGVPESVTVATVSALGGVLQTHRHLFGCAGVGLMPLWSPPLRFRGTDYEIGRHAFTRTELGMGDGVSGYVLSMHIPPIGRLDAQQSEESVATAVEFFKRWYPEEPIAGLVCHSWLLDPQLAEYLRPDSNIIRFQSRFDLLPLLPPEDPSEGDRELMRLGLHLGAPAHPLTEEDLAKVPQDTTLRRAFVTHLRAGRHWYLRTGMLKAWS
ncbi:acyltransferase domain-containing protein [Kribbella sp. HUAS MG21]|uniref:Acyltransferase domain-containing protein n=1 Tax=Kribbella sp. HUAS MG21 TaxID=3160966 RepID=A0AAU7TJ47_9ACTN